MLALHLRYLLFSYINILYLNAHCGIAEVKLHTEMANFDFHFTTSFP